MEAIMGNHTAGNAMGKQAQALLSNRPQGMTAIELLDLICTPYRGCDAEFESEDPEHRGFVHPEFGDWRDPHPQAALGMLMLEAFAPNGVSDQPRYAAGFDERNDEAALDAWYAEVEVPFRQRYRFC
ncbi:MAG: hypothetical protein EPN64_04655 [Burkholderiaceae bacterium]|nr:MAG: hypothetical protein EPN64_04655 [Burkholderiaceae bacterium]